MVPRWCRNDGDVECEKGWASALKNCQSRSKTRSGLSWTYECSVALLTLELSGRRVAILWIMGAVEDMRMSVAIWQKSVV